MRIIHHFLQVVKLFPEGTHFDTNCWIIEIGGESVIEQFNPFNHKIQVLYQCRIIIQ
jgi:hypothetical protein